MNRIYIFIIVALIASLIEKPAIGAKENSVSYNLEGRVGFEFRVSRVYFAEDELILFENDGIKTDLDPASAFGGIFTYYINKNVSFEIYASYISTVAELRSIRSNILLSQTDVSSIPVLVSFHYKTPVKEFRSLSYIFGGVGYFLNDADAADLSNSMAYHLGIGFEYLASRNLSINSEIRKCWTSPTETILGSSFVSEVEYSVNPLYFSVGIRYYIPFEK